MNENDEPEMIFGEEVKPEKMDFPIYPVKIWRKGINWNDPAMQVSRAALEGDIRRMNILQPQCHRFEVIKLPNIDINIERAERTAYTIAEEKYNDIIATLIMEVLASDDFARLRNEYETVDRSANPINMIFNVRNEGNSVRGINYGRWERNVRVNRTRDQEKEFTKRFFDKFIEICWRFRSSWVKLKETTCEGSIFMSSVAVFRGVVKRIRKVATICEGLDIDNIVKKKPFDAYGNCMICFSRGPHNTRCRREGCGQHVYSRIMCFTNVEGWFINPCLIEAVMGGRWSTTRAEGPLQQDSTTQKLCLPLDTDEYFLNHEVCLSKLLWYAQIYNEEEKELMLHVMNKVSTTYEVLMEMEKLCMLLGVQERKKRTQMWMWAHLQTTYMERPYRQMMTTTGMSAMPIIIREIRATSRPVVQQERDGENANLDPEENGNDQEDALVNDVQDNRRDRDEETDDERNVRPRWGPWP